MLLRSKLVGILRSTEVAAEFPIHRIIHRVAVTAVDNLPKGLETFFPVDGVDGGSLNGKFHLVGGEFVVQLGDSPVMLAGSGGLDGSAEILVVDVGSVGGNIGAPVLGAVAAECLGHLAGFRGDAEHLGAEVNGTSEGKGGDDVVAVLVGVEDTAEHVGKQSADAGNPRGGVGRAAGDGGGTGVKRVEGGSPGVDRVPEGRTVDGAVNAVFIKVTVGHGMAEES